MFRKLAVGLAVGLMTLVAVSVGASASPSGQIGQSLTVERSEDRLSATADWTPNPDAESQAFFVVAKLLEGEEDTTGFGIDGDSFRYVDFPLDGDIATLVIDELDSGRDYIYGVVSGATDANGEWVWGEWDIVRNASRFTSGSVERDALVALYHSTGGPRWVNSANWLSESPIGDWRGVTAGPDGRVVEVNLWLNGLSGEIPPELGNLVTLERLYLWLNALNGDMPAELGRLPRLEELYLSGNRLTGEIPPELGNLWNLERLYLSGGNEFTGCIPSGLKNVAENDLADLGLPFCS